jgi:hypothetical protein
MHTLALAFALLLVAAPATSVASPVPNPDRFPARAPRVRPYDTRTAALLIAGLQRSRTLRDIVDEVEAGDVIVYLQMQPTLRGRLAGSLTWLTKTDRVRYVRISISPDISGDTAVATLGHELRHVLEVAAAPSIVDPESLTAHYRKIGISMRSHDNGWDTEAAQQAGDDVRKDLAASRAARAVDTPTSLEPLAWDALYRNAREQAR